jgi:hypothetical protein
LEILGSHIGTEAQIRVADTGFPLLTYKLRTGGVTWLTQRLLEEWRLPRTAAGPGACWSSEQTAGIGGNPRLSNKLTPVSTI